MSKEQNTEEVDTPQLDTKLVDNEDVSNDDNDKEESKTAEDVSNDDDDDDDNEDEDNDNDNESDYSSEEDDELTDSKDPLKCRMYQNTYPKTGDLVIVEVKKIVDMGAYCNLLEYNNLEGMLLMSELQRRRIRSVKRVIKEGRQEIVQVLRVNREKHFIDLSKKRVDAEEMPKVEDRWSKSKAAHSIMRQVSVLSEKKYSMKDLYKLFGFKCAKKYGHLYDAFKYAMNHWDEFLIAYPSIPQDVHAFLLKNIEKRLKPQMVTVRAKVEITCFTKEGVDAIKKSLKAGLKIGNDDRKKKTNSDSVVDDDMNIKIKLVAPPLFTVSVSTFEPDRAIILVNNVIQTINDTITESKGTLTIKQDPKIIQVSIES